MTIRHEVATNFQFDYDDNRLIVGQHAEKYTGAEKCLIVRMLTPEALLENINISLRTVVGESPNLFRPPTTPVGDFNLLVVEVLMRYQELLRKTK